MFGNGKKNMEAGRSAPAGGAGTEKRPIMAAILARYATNASRLRRRILRILSSAMAARGRLGKAGREE